jgi:hypothetical protein
VESFRRGAALLALPPQIVAIPYQGSALPAYFFRAAALERGYNVLAFDGPGQGSMLIDRGIPLRPDWENVITPVVDYLLTRPDVDSGRIALIGLSLGGYLAPRAATAERRLAACVSDCGPYDVFDVAARRLPGFLARQLPDGSPVLLRLLGRLLRLVMSKPTAGWAMRRNLLVHGLSDPLDYFRIAPQYSLKGIEDRIQCPTFVCSAEGAGQHCESGARTVFHARAFDWLDHVLDLGVQAGGRRGTRDRSK